MHFATADRPELTPYLRFTFELKYSQKKEFQKRMSTRANQNCYNSKVNKKWRKSTITLQYFL